jgi:peroxiredoxin
VISVVTEDTVLPLADGSVEITEDIQLNIAEEDENGIWSIVDGTTVTAVDSNGNPISIRIDSESGNLVTDDIVTGNIAITVTDPDGKTVVFEVTDDGIVDVDAGVDVRYIYPVENGRLGTDETAPVIADDTSGSWDLFEDVSITIKDGNGDVVDGTISFNEDGDLVFIPADGLSVPEVIIVQVGEGSYIYHVIDGMLTEPIFIPSNGSGGNSTGGGISSHPDSSLIVENGTISLEKDEFENITVAGTFINVSDSDVEIVLTDGNGNEITGSVVERDNKLIFVPDSETPILAGEHYDVTVIVDGNELEETEKIVISVDDMSAADSKFKTAQGFDTGSFAITDLLNDNGEAVFGWDFNDGEQFYFKVTNAPDGVKLILSAYGIYDIDGHKNEVYYQYFISNGEPDKPVKNLDIPFNYTLRVNPKDYVIQKEDGGFEDFATTYIEFTIVDSEGYDITESVDAIVEVWR